MLDLGKFAGAALLVCFFLSGNLEAQDGQVVDGDSSLNAAFSGTWTLDLEASDDLRANLRRAMQSQGGRAEVRPGRRGGQGRGGRGSGARRGGGRSGGPPGGGRRPGGGQQGDGGMAGLIQPGALDLTVGQDSMTVEFQPGDIMTLPLNGDGHTFPRRGRKTEVKAAWDEETLRVERKYEDGPEVVDVLELSPEGVLLVHRTLKIRGVKVEGTLVYTREGSGPDVH